ncbi:MAG: DUF4147 domain-containing protein [Phycisphaerae bacterium]
MVVKAAWRTVLEGVVSGVRAAAAPGPLVAAGVAVALASGRDLEPGAAVHLLAVGKAGAGMLEGIDPRVLPVRRACVTLPPGQAARWEPPRGVPARALACDHPLPTARNVEAAREVASFVASTPAADTLLVLLSGGASAHLTLPREGVSLEDVQAFAGALMRAGASIRELNACRRRLEALKGGGLARLRPAGSTLVLVLSDVIGDPLEVIGSGPFTPDSTRPEEAIAAFDRFIPRGAHTKVRSALEASPSAVDRLDPCFRGVTHRVVGNNDRAVEGAVAALRERGIAIGEIHRAQEGPVASWASLLLNAMRGPAEGPQAWVVGGEPVVNVGETGGTGGPSQELALTIAAALDGVEGWVLATLSTDGIDGPTHVAGAIVDGGTCRRALQGGVDPAKALAAHDSTRALEAAGDALVTGPTGTNVNHVAALVRFPTGWGPR